MICVFILLVNLKIFLFSQEYLAFHVESYFFEVDIRIGEGHWGFFVDTLNDYSILYDPPNEYEWPYSIINENKVTKGEDKIINNYYNPIDATIYSLPIRVNNNENLINNFSLYYSKSKCKDELVWDYISDNYRQLSCGFGLNVQDPQFSLISSLYTSNYIATKSISFFSDTMVVLGRYPENRENFLYKFTYNIPSKEKEWGMYINSITLGGKQYTLNKYVLINSAIQPIFRSNFIYSIFREYLLGDTEFKNNCSENLANKTIDCSFDLSIRNTTHNIIIKLDNGIQFNFSLSDFFEESSSVYSLKYIYNDNAHNANTNNDVIQVGINFIKLFDKMELNFDYRNVTFYSNNTDFLSQSNYYSINTKKIIIFYCISFLLIIFSCILGAEAISIQKVISIGNKN